MVFGAKYHTENRNSFNKPRPTHFPITPYLYPPPVPALPREYLADNRSLRVTAISMETNASTGRRELLDQRRSTPTTSIYDAFARVPSSVPRTDPRLVARERAAGLLSPIPVDRHRTPSRSSSFDNFSNTPSIYSPSSTVTDLNETLDAQLRQSVPGSDGGYDSASTAGRAGRRNRSNARQQMRHPDVLEEHADEDKVSARISIGSRIKADKVLGLPAPTTALASAYICSGLGVVSAYSTCHVAILIPATRSLDIRRLGCYQRNQTVTRINGCVLETRDPFQLLHRRRHDRPLFPWQNIRRCSDRHRCPSTGTSTRWTTNPGRWSTGSSIDGRQVHQGCASQRW